MSAKQYKLPLLPGFSFNSSMGKEYFGKKQHFSLMGGEICVIAEEKNITHRPQSIYSKGLMPDVPSWVLYDKQILTFDAKFLNDTTSTNILPFKRPVKILYYLEDGTMKVVEPKTDNSGLCQGTIVGRQRIPLPDNDSSHFDVGDLNIGNEIEIYGKKFLIVNCDKFTRLFLHRLGIRVPEPLEQCEQKEPCEVRNIRTPFIGKGIKSSVQFFEFDRKILRFYGFWDDRQSEHGILHHLEILYYLADDTIEIREIFPPKFNKETGAVFLKRAPLPKKMMQCLVASYGEPVETYSPSDLSIGAAINAFGRMVTLTDCDPFTREYYRSKYGIDNFESIMPPEPLIKSHSEISLPRQLPPWNGFGSHEDSAGNCDTIAPKAPRCDFTKFLEKDSIGKDSHILRFSAKLLTDIPENDMRSFVVSYYLRDDTISVFELGIRNSGFRGGMFYKRNAVILPGQNLSATQTPICYTTKDMWTGNVLTINDHRFHLMNADKYTLQYMEQHFEVFPKSNVILILNKIKNQLLSRENGYKDFVAKNMHFVNPDQRQFMAVQFFEQAIKDIVGDLLTEHEFITVARYFKVDDSASINRENIRSLVNAYLVRNLWQDNIRLLEHFRYLDEENVGLLSRLQVRQALLANRLPIPSDLLEDMLNVIKSNGDNQLSYDDVMDFLNFKLKPPQKFIATPAKSTKRIQSFCPAKLISDKPSDDMMVNWDVFVRHLDLEHTLTEKP